MKIPLFDVDGTLTFHGNRIQNRALKYAFKKLYNLDASMDEISPHGMIESQIINEILVLHDFKEKEIVEDLEKIYEKMREYINEVKDAKYHAKEGAIEVLEALKQKGVLIGALTGNMDTVAEAKMSSAGVWDYIDFGAYGNEGEKRTDLVYLAKVRAEHKLGRTIGDKELVIIGDTPRDVICAKDTGIESIAVTNGMATREAIEKEKPDLIIASLENKDAILSFLEI